MTVADDLSPAENDTSEDRTRGLPLGLRPYWWAMVLALRELGGRAHRSDLLEPISAIMDLSPEMLAEQLPSRTGNYFEFNLDRAAQDLKDEHALHWGQRQVTAQAASAGDMGDTHPGLEVSTKPLSETESWMRAFMKEVSAWISECKAYNAECKLARAKNTQAGTGTGN